MNSDIQLLLQKKANGEMSMNQVYANYSNAGGTGNFKDFMSKAQQSGWIDQGLNALSSVASTKYGIGAGGTLITNTPCTEGYEKDSTGVCVEIKKGMSTGVKIGIAVGLIAIIGGVVYMVNKNK